MNYAGAPSNRIRDNDDTRSHIGNLEPSFTGSQLKVTQLVPPERCFCPIELNRYAFTARNQSHLELTEMSSQQNAWIKLSIGAGAGVDAKVIRQLPPSVMGQGHGKIRVTITLSRMDERVCSAVFAPAVVIDRTAPIAGVAIPQLILR